MTKVIVASCRFAKGLEMRSESLAEVTKKFNVFYKIKPWNSAGRYVYCGRTEGLFSGLETEAVVATVR